MSAVGRTYVTVDFGPCGRKFQNWNSDMLLEKVNIGTSGYLFKTRQEAEDYIEFKALKLWIGTLSMYTIDKYSLEQLRQVKEILSEKKDEE